MSLKAINLNNPNWRAFWLAVLLIVIALGILHRCNRPIPVPHHTVETRVRDSIRTVVEVKDSLRVVTLHHWHTIRHDSLIPCETMLLFADTVIMIDSSLIASLKSEIVQDSIIEAKLNDIVNADSVVIGKLNKRLRRQRVLTKVAFVTGLVGGGVIGFKVH